MSVYDCRAAGQRLARAVRRRVRLRTRVRQAGELWRAAVPRRLPRWSGDPMADPSPARSGTALVAGAVWVDRAAVSPPGQQRYGPRLPAGRLRCSGAGWEIVRGRRETPLVAGRVGAPLSCRQVAVLAQLGAVAFGPDADPQLLAQLALTGVVLHAVSPAGATAPGQLPGLAMELAAVLAAPLPDRSADPLGWEIRSVRQRRAALRHHTGLSRPPAVSALLVTQRPERVPAAVAAIAAQTYPELEIVVGVHGVELPAGLSSGDRPLRVVRVPADRCLGEALAVAGRSATGTLVTKVDDDDRYGPEHIWDLVLGRHHSGAVVTGKGAEFVYLEPDDLTVRRRMAAETFTDTVAGGTLLLARDELAAAGGWPPVPRWVDRALLDRVLAAGGAVYRTHPFGFIYTRHSEGHTWQVDLGHFRRNPRQRWRGLPRHEEFGTV